MRLFIFALIGAFLAGTLGFAQVLTEPTGDEWLGLLNQIATLKGASNLVIIAFVVQLAMFLLRSKIGEKAGKWRLSIVLGLTAAATLLSEYMQGGNWLTALQAAPVIAALQVFFHQLYQQYLTEKGNA